MKLSLMPLLLLAATGLHHVKAEAIRFPFDQIIEISEFVESGDMTEEAALGLMQQTIDYAKKQVAEHKPVDAAEMARVLDVESLSSETWGVALNDAPEIFERVAMSRSGNSVTVTLGQKGQNGSRTFSLEGTEEADKTFKTLFANWRAIVVKIAIEPNEYSRIARATPEELLARGRAINRDGGGTKRYMRTTLELHDGDLVIEGKGGLGGLELMYWHNAITKLVAPQMRLPAIPKLGK